MMAVPVTPLPEHFNTLPLPLSEQLCRPFSFAEILSATNNFDDSLVIGHGGFGKVYKGVIDNGASIVAIKRLSSASKQGDSEFRTEMEMLSKFRHSHIVSLIGYCYSSTEMILVYEYMVNGSLADQLHKIGKCGTNSNLSWVQRLKICLGAARGLDYLHTGTGVQNSVIHCDMKSSNILLDKNCAAKVSDFGLSRINPIDQSCTHISTNVKGTTGYMDPEYMLTFRLTMKSDVYSFGVVLFEVLCGRRAVDFTLAEEQWSLARWAQCCIEKGTLHRIINPNLWLEILPESLTEFVRIANQCLCYWPKKRPTMTQVVGSLELALALQLGHRDSSAFEMEIICTSEADEIIKNVDSTVVQEEMQPFKFLTVDDASEKQIAMEPLEMAINGTKQVSPDHLPFARSYQLEVLEKAIKQNTVVFLETGSGKTLIAIMLLRSYAYLLRKPSPYISVFLVPTVVLVTQQAEAVKTHTDLKVGKYWGEMGVDYWDAATWKKEQDEYEVLVMTPKILLDALRHSFLKLEMIRVLIFDECHNAKGKHPYACIMKEFYHRLLATKYQPPRIFGMTASPVKAKVSGFALDYWKQIRELENLMNSKIYTCVNESVLAEYIPFSTMKLKFYEDMDIPSTLSKGLMHALTSLREKYELSIERSTISETSAESAKCRLTKLFNQFEFCTKELGVWLAFKAAESLSCDDENDTFSWGKLDLCGETIARDFISDALKIFSSYLPSGPNWSIANDTKANVDAGYLTMKVICLIESLLEYRDLQGLRCIVFVERVITAIVLQTLLDELLPELTGWKTEYTAGNTCKLQSQSRKKQNKIVDEFRKGAVNIIVATSMLEEGLDVQSCNLVIRFDPSATVCSFIQSRGRARMQDSVFLLLVKSGDNSTLAQVKNYLVSGDVMRQESLSHASIPCEPLDGDLSNEIFYRVETTGALATLSSSVSLIYFYCSRLPSDGYFKPSPRCHIDKESETCTLYLPKSCPLQSVRVQQNIKILKQFACLEACKQLHQIGALTDNLVPDIVVEEAGALKLERYLDEQMIFAAPELISRSSSDHQTLYHCYLIELQRKFEYDIPVQDIVLAVRTKFDDDDLSLAFDLEVDRGNMGVHIKYVGVVHLASEQVVLCQRFQLSIFRVLLDHNQNKLDDVLNAFSLRNDLSVFDYLLLPSTGSPQNLISIDWKCVCSFLWDDSMNCSSPSCNGRRVQTKNCLTCLCMLENCLVYTPHNGHVYCTTGIMYDLNGNSLLELKDGEAVTYKQYFQKKGIDLLFEGEPLINGRHIFPVQNHLLRRRQQQKAREPSNSSVELPPELCSIIMSPISVSTFFSFSFVPSIMHRIESLLIASNLKKIHADHCMQNVNIPTFKVLEAITTKRCQEKYHLESMETLGDSFLKYAASKQLFMMHQNHHEGLLSVKREKIISNAALCKLGCDMKLTGFIRTEPFDPKTWIIPGDYSEKYELSEEFLYSKRKVYVRGRRQIKGKVVADVVEALIGAFLSSGGEVAAIQFMKWIGIEVGFTDVPLERKFPIHPEMHINIPYLESLLNYSFHDASLLVEALTHGSYMLPEIPRCYQRLEFLGDAVLDYLVTVHLYEKYPGLSPGLLTDLRSASVNNDCYAQSAVKAGLHKHILHASKELHGQIVNTVHNFNESSEVSTYGWECETYFPKVLGDIIESLAGAILVDSGYKKDVVFKCIRPLLEPLITPETVRLQPVRELNDLCQKKNYIRKKAIVSCEKGVASITIEVDANGVIHKETYTAEDKKMAKKLASKALLKTLKEISQ